MSAARRWSIGKAITTQPTTTGALTGTTTIWNGPFSMMPVPTALPSLSAASTSCSIRRRAGSDNAWLLSTRKPRSALTMTVKDAPMRPPWFVSAEVIVSSSPLAMAERKP